MRDTNDITALLLEWKDGSRAALEKLAPLVYQELRRIAQRYMAAEQPGHTLQPSALVNEAFMRLIDARRVAWENRAHFFATSAQIMRHILVDFARRKRYQKRDAGAVQVDFNDSLIAAADRKKDLVALDDALRALAALNPRVSQMVELRYFGGLSEEETAEVLKVSCDTVLRDWKFAKAWLHRELSPASSK